jgi:oligopeptide/dipeptide ABC transporter ATP-binding protein
MTSPPLLAVENLSTHFFTERGVVRAVDGVDLTVHRAQTLGVVGESGCGKSVTMLSILRLIANPPGRIVSGRIIFDGHDLLTLPPAQMRRIRGDRIALIPQDPMAALNPAFRIGEQIDEVLMVHRGLNRAAARAETIRLLDRVGIPAARTRANDYPHHFSGGMSQRVMIAMALACHPELVIADEPTTALDVTIQAQILDLLRGLIHEHGTAIVLITHDLGVVAEICDQVAVMYAGKVVEYTDVVTLFDAPLHPYTVALHNSIPRPGDLKQRLHVIPGQPPDLARMPSGCPFRTRCLHAMAQCAEAMPQMREVRPGHWVRCFLHSPM